MIETNTIQEIAEELNNSQNIVMYPHVNMDGDALGSCVALCHALKTLGKVSGIRISEKVPENLVFLGADEWIISGDVDYPVDLSLLVDCGEIKRIPGREEDFNKGKRTMCIDHHGTTEAFCQINYIDPDAAATGQIIFEIIKELGVKGTKTMGEALFAAITTDTGNFQYSNTQKISHEIVAELYDWGIDHHRVSEEIYENNRVERLKLTAKALDDMELLAEGKGVIAAVSQAMLTETGGRMEETEWIASELRSIRGVQIAALLKEEEDGRIKCSLRSKETADVAALAEKFGGGGHIRAAGYTDYCSLEEARAKIRVEIEKLLGGQ